MGVIFQSCENFGSKFFLFKILKTEDVFGIVSEVDVVVQPCNCFDIFFLNGFP